MRELGEMGLEVLRVDGLEGSRGVLVAAYPLRGWELLVERVPDQRVTESQPGRRSGNLADHALGDRLVENLEQLRRGKPARRASASRPNSRPITDADTSRSRQAGQPRPPAVRSPRGPPAGCRGAASASPIRPSASSRCTTSATNRGLPSVSLRIASTSPGAAARTGRPARCTRPRRPRPGPPARFARCAARGPARRAPRSAAR